MRVKEVEGPAVGGRVEGPAAAARATKELGSSPAEMEDDGARRALSKLSCSTPTPAGKTK